MSRYSHPVQWSHALWAASEPFTLGMLFIPEGRESLAELGVSASEGYVTVRSAPMGRAAAPVVTAAFHGFPLAVIAEVVPAVWERTTPDAVIAAHQSAIPAAAARIFGETVDPLEVQRVADVLAETCSDLDTSGRPLAAGSRAVAP